MTGEGGRNRAWSPRIALRPIKRVIMSSLIRSQHSRCDLRLCSEKFTLGFVRRFASGARHAVILCLHARRDVSGDAHDGRRFHSGRAWPWS